MPPPRAVLRKNVVGSASWRSPRTAWSLRPRKLSCGIPKGPRTRSRSGAFALPCRLRTPRLLLVSVPTTRMSRPQATKHRRRASAYCSCSACGLPLSGAYARTRNKVSGRLRDVPCRRRRVAKILGPDYRIFEPARSHDFRASELRAIATPSAPRLQGFSERP